MAVPHWVSPACGLFGNSEKFALREARVPEPGLSSGNRKTSGSCLWKLKQNALAREIPKVGDLKERAGAA